MKKILGFLFCAMSLSSACFADEEPTTALEQAPVDQEEQGELAAQYNDGMNNGNMTAPSCSGLPADQQNFAMQLNPGNKNMFCTMFSMDQRKQAMQMMGKPGMGGGNMTADQAVEQVAKNNNMTPSAPAAGQSNTTPKKGIGGCPVR